MEFRNLTTFVRAAELRSFSQAARQLGYSQSAVSMQISQLEAELGTSLFDRVGKTVALTPHGAKFYEYAQNILRMAENAKKIMHDASAVSGQLRIVMAESLCMSIFPKILDEFCSRHPDVQITVRGADSDEMFKALTQNDADLIYHLDPLIYRPDCVTAMSSPVPIVFAAPACHPLAGKKNISVAECIRYPFILTEKGMSYRSQLDTQLAQLDMSIEPFLEIGNTDVISSLVERSTDRIAFIPEFVIHDQLEAGTIVKLDVTDINVELYRQLIYHKGKWITPAMQAMIDTICSLDSL